MADRMQEYVAAHIDDADAHHAKYTDAEARTACIEDDAYGAGWDGDTTHAPSQNAVYDRILYSVQTAATFAASGTLMKSAGIGSRNIEELSNALTEAQLADLLMFGSANAAWVPMAFAGSNNGNNVYWSNWGGYYRNDGAGDLNLNFTLNVPFIKGALSVIVSEVRVVLSDADASNYINRVRVWCDGVGKLDDNTNRTAADTYDYDITDCTPTYGLHCYIDCACATQADLKFNVLAKIHYA